MLTPSHVDYKNCYPIDALPKLVVLVDGGLDTKPTGGGFMVVSVSGNILQLADIVAYHCFNLL